MAALRSLGVRANEALRVTERSAAIPAVTLEERVRAALTFLGPNPRVRSRMAAGTGAFA